MCLFCVWGVCVWLVVCCVCCFGVYVFGFVCVFVVQGFVCVQSLHIPMIRKEFQSVISSRNNDWLFLEEMTDWNESD